MSLIRLVLILLLTSVTVVSLLGATLRGLTEPSTDERERWEMLGLASTALASGLASVVLLLGP
ncbi:MAG: hypothetical protein AAGA81_04525 [Acidobacteriota bacterium]